MAIESPRQPVYYYEASNGRFRLVYFIPPEMLARLSDSDQISPEVLKDYPDGVDLSCTAPDFAEFAVLYGYRVPHDPEALQRAFFTIFSSTRNWKKFRGSGLIPAADLENALGTVEESLHTEGLAEETIQPFVRESKPEERQRSLSQRVKQQKRMTTHLQQMMVEGVDPKRSMRQQQFSKIQMQEGESAEDVFSDLLRKQKGA
jgi:hypothetical protein